MATIAKKTIVKRTVKPKDSETQYMKQPKTKDEWLEARRKSRDPNWFTVNEEGNLLSKPTQKGDVELVIEIEPQVPASDSHILEQMGAKLSRIQEAESAYVNPKRQLFDAYRHYKAGAMTASQYVLENQKVRDAECMINSLAKDPRSIEFKPDLMGRDLNLTDIYDTRKIVEPVVSLYSVRFPPTYFWMDKPTEKMELSEEITSQEEKVPQKNDSERARLAAIIRNKQAKKITGM